MTIEEVWSQGLNEEKKLVHMQSGTKKASLVQREYYPNSLVY